MGSFTRLLTLDGWPLILSEFGPSIVRVLFLLVGTYVTLRIARPALRYAVRRAGADFHAQFLAARVATILIVGLGIATILDTVGIPLTTFVTLLGVAGLTISLATQDILKSFVAGTYLLFERPFRLGDEISVKDQRGTVEHIGIRTTRLRNADNVQVIVPNSMLFAEIVANRTNERKSEPEPAVQPGEGDHELAAPTPATGMATPAPAGTPPASAPTPAAAQPPSATPPIHRA